MTNVIKGNLLELGRGYYNINEIGLSNKSIRSVKVPESLGVVQFDNSDYPKKSVTLTSDTKCLEENKYNFNDKTTSIMVI